MNDQPRPGDDESRGDDQTPQQLIIPIPGTTDRFLVAGDISELEVEETISLPEDGFGSAARGIRDLAATLNVPVQMIAAWESSAHLVRLSPGTVAMLQNGARFMESGGLKIGPLVGQNGKIVGHAAFVPAASAAAFAASMGSALTAVAIQMQLKEINVRLQRIETAVSDVRFHQRTELQALARATAAEVRKGVEQARAAGRVTPEVVSALPGFGRDLAKAATQLRADIARQLQQRPTQGRAKKTAEWLQAAGVEMLENLLLLIEVGSALSFVRILQAWLLLESDDPANHKAGRVQIAQAVEEAAANEKLVLEAGAALSRTLEMVHQGPGVEAILSRIAQQMGLTGDARSAVRQMSAKLQKHLAATGLELPPGRRFPHTLPAVGNDPTPEDSQWKTFIVDHLQPGEQPRLIVYGRGAGRPNNFETEASVLLLTDRRMLALRKESFIAQDTLVAGIDLRDIKGVRLDFSVPGGAYASVHAVIGLPALLASSRVLRVAHLGELDIALDGLSKRAREHVLHMVRRHLESAPQAWPQTKPDPKPLPPREPLAVLSAVLKELPGGEPAA